MNTQSIFLVVTQAAEEVAASDCWYNSMWIFIPLLIVCIILGFVISDKASTISSLENSLFAKNCTDVAGHVVGYGKHLFGM